VPNDHGHPVGAWCSGANIFSAHQALGWFTEPGREQGLDIGFGARSARELHQMVDEGVGVGGGQPARGEAAIVEARGTQARQHRAVEGRVVLGEHGVQRESDQ
jgi:hypothetical protein